MNNVVYPPFGARGATPPPATVAGLAADPRQRAEAIRLSQLADAPPGLGAAAVESEPALRLRALRLANGPAFAGLRPCASVPEALDRLGERGVHSLLVGAACARLEAPGPAQREQLAARTAIVLVAERVLRQAGLPVEGIVLVGCLPPPPGAVQEALDTARAVVAGLGLGGPPALRRLHAPQLVGLAELAWTELERLEFVTNRRTREVPPWVERRRR